MPDESREKRAQSIKAFVESHTDVPVIVTCRERDYDDEALQLGLPVVHVRPLDDQRICDFITKRMGNDKLWHTLQDEALHELAKNPYNLVMFISLATPDGTLPDSLKNLNDLYRLYVERRYNEYSKDNLVRLSWEHLQKALETLAFRMIARGKGTEADEVWCRRQIGRKALRDGIDLGVLIPDAGKIRFYHQSLHQYFALPGLSDALKPKWHDKRFTPDRRRNFIIQIGDLGEGGMPTIPMLMAVVLNDTVSDVRLAAAHALGNIGETAVDSLIKALNDDNTSVRQNAVEALGNIGDVRAVEPLMALHDDVWAVRRIAAEALGNIGDAAVDSLIKALAEKSVRSYAAEALGIIGDVRAVEPLIKALKDYYGRSSVAEALGKIGDVRAVEPLINVFNGEDDERIIVAEALGKIGDVHAVEPLIKALTEYNLSIDAFLSLAYSAGEALGNIGETAIEPLIKALTDRNPWVRRIAAEALEKIGTTEALEALKQYRKRK